MHTVNVALSFAVSTVKNVWNAVIACDENVVTFTKSFWSAYGRWEFIVARIYCFRCWHVVTDCDVKCHVFDCALRLRANAGCASIYSHKSSWARTKYLDVQCFQLFSFPSEIIDFYRSFGRLWCDHLLKMNGHCIYDGRVVASKNEMNFHSMEHGGQVVRFLSNHWFN